MRIYVCHASSFDYDTELYQPIKASHLYSEHEFFLPHDSDNINTKTSDIINQFDLVIGEVSYPSTGQGMELGLAVANNIPIACVYQQGTQPSTSLRFYCQQLLAYSGGDSLVSALEALIANYDAAKK